MRSELSQRQRMMSLLMDIVVLLGISLYGFGSVIPPFGDKGFWFYTALLSILIGTKLATPFYVKPVDAVSYAIPAFISLMLTNYWKDWSYEAQVSYVIAVSIAAITGCVAILCILLNGWKVVLLQDLSDRLRLISEQIAKPAVIYSPVMIFSMFAFHFESPRELMAVFVATLFTTAFSIGDVFLKVLVKLKQSIFFEELFKGFGEIAAFQKPGLYLLRTESIKEENLPIRILINDEFAGTRVAYATDILGRERGHLCRSIDLGPVEWLATGEKISSIPKNFSVEVGLNSVFFGRRCLEKWEEAEKYVGYVAQDSTVARLFFEVICQKGLSVGRLVSVKVGDDKVFYQLVAGFTKEEVVHQKNTNGYIRAQAQQIGIWNGEKFSQCRWLPQINSPVTLEENSEYQMTPRSVGRFPHTNFHAEIGNVSHLVTHNTAILGILGVGKSMLAIELVERMLAEGIKVICLDLTNQYSIELDAYFCKDKDEESRRLIQEACDKDRDESKDNPEEGGSLPNLKDAIQRDIANFLSEENPQLLKVYNPSEFVATRQEYEPKTYQAQGKWHRAAGLYAVTPVEATQIVAEATLQCASSKMSDVARICLVFEEAHSLVPEWNSVVSDGDKRATSGTARAILQGRKFGLGCLLITQRTANVTKTILNQCNTIFAMRTFDETGKDFLSNYIGEGYASELSTIQERHAVFFGRASSCENPVLIALNDRAQFLNAFRQENPPPPKDILCGAGAVVVPSIENEEDFNFFDDDVPF